MHFPFLVCWTHFLFLVCWTHFPFLASVCLNQKEGEEVELRGFLPVALRHQDRAVETLNKKKKKEINDKIKSFVQERGVVESNLVKK